MSRLLFCVKAVVLCQGAERDWSWRRRRRGTGVKGGRRLRVLRVLTGREEDSALLSVAPVPIGARARANYSIGGRAS